ncbi:MAG: carbohydrate porin [Nitrospinota bacterium]|nr:carbohydrate porin [Nitrospinota bacterium]
MNRKSLLILSCLIAFSLIFPGLTYSADDEGGEESSSTLLEILNKKGIVSNEELKVLNKSEGSWFDTIELSGGITSGMQGTSGNSDTVTGTSDGTNYSFSLDIGIDAELEPGHTVSVALESGEGEGIGAALPDGALGPNYDPANSNMDGAQVVTVAQAFYEGSFFDGKFVFDLGKMDLHSLYDENNFAGDETAQFMNGIFCRLTGTLYPELEWYYSPGMRFFFAPVDLLEVSYVLGNSKWEDFGSNLFQVVQLNLKPNLFGKEGNYRVYYIMDDTLRTQTVVDPGDPAATIDMLLPATKTADGSRAVNTGFGVSIDQYIMEGVGLSIRYGSQDKAIDQNGAVSAMTFGILVEGGIWGMDDDSFGFAYGSLTSNDKTNGSVMLDATGEPYTGQTAIEIFYHWQVKEKIGITPDIQMISNMPRADAASITVFGLRGQFDF